MKNLIILRHASPAAQGTDGTDFTRPLTPEGENEASLQGGFLREAGIQPDVVAASTALRAMTTAERLVAAIGAPVPLVPVPELYNAPGEALLDYVHTLPDDADTALVVAHMPGVAELVFMLATNPQDMTVAFCAAMLVGISLDSAERWSDAGPGSGVLEWLLPPLVAR